MPAENFTREKKFSKHCLKLHAYKKHTVQALEPDNWPLQKEFFVDMFKWTDSDNSFLDISLSDRSTFHMSCMINRHNCRIWGSEKPHVVHRYKHINPKLNVCCTLFGHMVIGAFYFQEQTVNSSDYLDMLHLYAILQMAHFQLNGFFQEDGALLHWSLAVQPCLDEIFPEKWTGWYGPTAWLPCFPNITLWISFSWVK